jgi:hypothetical protein
MFQPILPFLVYPLDNLHFFLTCHKWAKSEKFGREFIVVGNGNLLAKFAQTVALSGGN